MSENTTQNATPETPEDDPILVRHAKREALIAAGENPYGHAFAYSHHIIDLDEKYAGLEDGENTEDRVEVAGRVMAKRDQGKIIFMELRDSTGSIQLFCRINALGEEVFAAMKDLDVGDWIGVSGLMMRAAASFPWRSIPTSCFRNRCAPCRRSSMAWPTRSCAIASVMSTLS